jgi:hypothetical protein
MKKLIESLVKMIDPSDGSRKVFIRRPIRVKVEKAHDIELTINDKMIQIENINSTGLGLSLLSFDVKPVPNEKINAILKITNSIFPIEIQVVYVNNIIGCRIHNIKRDLVNKIESYFQYEILGNSLTRIKSEKLKPDPDGIPISFFGSEQFELNLIVEKQKVIKFNITFFDKYLELNKEQILKVGIIKSYEEKSPFAYKKSDVIDFNNQNVSTEDKINLDKILLNINSLDKEHYVQIINHIKTL